MSVEPATVAKIAALARIKMSEGEIAAMVPNTLRLRADVVGADPLTGGGIREVVLANAPAAEHGFFGVPKVIE